jgi:5-methylthioadenosine/S-adenosylhomocysteine deaminase
MNEIIIKNGLVLTMDKRRSIYEKGVVKIVGDEIRYVGPENDNISPGSPTSVLDAAGKVVLPGLINAHTHMCMTFGKTVCHDANLMEWINKIQYPLMDEMGEEGYYLAELVGCMENLRNGNTTVVESLVSSSKEGVTADSASLKAYRETRLRGVLARAYADQNYYPNAIEKPEEILERSKALIHACRESEQGRLQFSIGPVLPWCSSRRMYEEIHNLREELGVGLHMHASESADWNTKGYEVHGYSTNVALYRAFGCLGPKTVITAMRVITDGDIAALAETATSLIHDPPAVLNRGTGLPPIPKALAAGVKVGLCTNALGQDMFEAMKTAGWNARIVAGVPDALPVERALEMGTIGNAEALGMAEKIGSIEAGKKADLIVVRLDKLQHAPCLNVISALVNTTSGRDVEDVIVDGNIIVRNGRFVNLDEDSILRQAHDKARYFCRKAHLDDRLLPLGHS